MPAATESTRDVGLRVVVLKLFETSGSAQTSPAVADSAHESERVRQALGAAASTADLEEAKPELDPGLVSKVRRYEQSGHDFKPVKRSVVDELLSFALVLGLLTRHRPAVTTDDEGGLSLEVRLSPTAELFLDLSPSGEADAIILDDVTGVLIPDGFDLPTIARSLAMQASA